MPHRTYINKKATGKQIVFVSRVMVLVYGVLSGVMAIVLQRIGLSLGWVYLVSDHPLFKAPDSHCTGAGKRISLALVQGHIYVSANIC